MRVWRKFLAWWRPQPPAMPGLPYTAIPLYRPDGSVYMHIWVDTTYADPRVCIVFGGNLRGHKIMFSAHALPQLKKAVEQLSRIPLPPLKTSASK